MMRTYVFLAECEIILHRFLRILVEWLALGPLGQGQQEVDEYQCLDQDVTLEGEITQLQIVSHSAGLIVAILRTSSLNRSRLVRYLGLKELANAS